MEGTGSKEAELNEGGEERLERRSDKEGGGQRRSVRRRQLERRKVTEVLEIQQLK